MMHTFMDSTTSMSAGELAPGLLDCGCRAGKHECDEARELRDRMDAARRGLRLGLCSRDTLLRRMQACLRHLSAAA